MRFAAGHGMASSRIFPNAGEPGTHWAPAVNPAKPPPRLPGEGSPVRARCYVETGRPCFIFILIQISLLSAKLSVLNGTEAK